MMRFSPHPHATITAARRCINADGQLIGIGSLWVGDAIEAGAAFPGNMFVPIDALRPILSDLKACGRRRGAARPWLGVYSEEGHGHVLVTQVLRGSPAERGGMRSGDIILAVGGRAGWQPIRVLSHAVGKRRSRRRGHTAGLAQQVGTGNRRAVDRSHGVSAAVAGGRALEVCRT